MYTSPFELENFVCDFSHGSCRRLAIVLWQVRGEAWEGADGGAIYVKRTRIVQLEGCTFIQNSAESVCLAGKPCHGLLLFSNAAFHHRWALQCMWSCTLRFDRMAVQCMSAMTPPVKATYSLNSAPSRPIQQLLYAPHDLLEKIDTRCRIICFRVAAGFATMVWMLL